MNIDHQQDDTVFHLRHVVKKREKGGNLFELQIEGFNICAGEFIAIVGESGCGKSTLLDMLGLALTPTSAEKFTIRIPATHTEHQIMSANEAALAAIRKTCLGYVLQTGGLLPFLTVTENIYLPCALNNLIQVDEHIQTLVKRLKIEEQMPKKPQFLSGGQRQRVAIARALAHRPPIVLADEPTAAVDKPTAVDIINEFRKLTRDLDVTLLMVTHDLNLVTPVADRMFTFEVHKESEQYTRSVFLEKAVSAYQ
jgi:putative ABC transport system ATP-binding protein